MSKRLLTTLGTALLVSLIVFFSFRDVSQSATYDLVIKFKNVDGSVTPNLQVELADTQPERSHGLMYRRSMPKNHGMLFVFPEPKEQGFWMKNTYLSLDMVFIGADRKVVGLLRKVPPLNTARRSVEAESLYVLELNAGRAEDLGIGVGSMMLVEGKLPVGR